jgi:hypothetical protein
MPSASCRRRGLNPAPILIAGLLASSASLAEENASNPLASVNNTDARLQYFDLDGPELYDFFVVDGAYMVTPQIKLKYEVHYWDTDVTGSSERGWEDDEAIPATLEVQLGKFFSPGFAAYVDALVGVGDDKPYEWGVGAGIRFKY